MGGREREREREREKLQTLKSKKACGPDGIMNEMLKNIDKKFQSAILKLFNLVLSVGFFPEIWNRGLITPIYKNGDKFDPNNYRGICVNSNLGKVFCNIMNTRLMSFLTKHNVLSKSQIGFIPKQRTTDHIYTLHTLIDKHINQNKNKLFACFIDFQKAFDSIWHDGLFYKIIESGIGGKTYDIIKSMYSGNMCSVKIGKMRTEYFTQGRGVRQGCNLSPGLFNIYINELATTLEKSSVPGVSLHNEEVKCLLFADDLVLLSPTAQGLQQSLDLLEHYCQTWALTVNPKKTKIMIFQKRSKTQDIQPKFKIGTQQVEYCTNYTYLGIKLNSTGHFNDAVHELRDKAHRAFYAIKKHIQTEIPTRIWLKLIECVIEPIALYGSEVWGPLTNHDFTQWDKHPIETLHAELCKILLHVQRKATNNACRAELGKYPLIIKIQKRAINFWTHLKLSDPLSYHYQALQCQDMSSRNPLTQLVQRLRSQTCTNPSNTAQEHTSSPITPNLITKQSKQNYIAYWQTQTKTQSKMQCYLALNRPYTTAEYLSTVTDLQLKPTLTKYRLSEHSLATETGRHPAEQRLCCHCSLNEPETELHFLTKCEKFKYIREFCLPKFEIVTKGSFSKLSDEEKLPILLGEESKSSTLAAVYVSACHTLRDSQGHTHTIS
uniref:ribonuclease H n=1 Tax=Sparus aurata TaxID=8175 RepID=A0A671W6R3_SPAAU